MASSAFPGQTLPAAVMTCLPPVLQVAAVYASVCSVRFRVHCADLYNFVVTVAEHKESCTTEIKNVKLSEVVPS